MKHKNLRGVSLRVIPIRVVLMVLHIYFPITMMLKMEAFNSLHDLATKSGYEDKIIQHINTTNSEFYPQFGGPKNLDELQNQFYMTPTNFVMFLNPYEYAPYAAGIREISMPYSWIR